MRRLYGIRFQLVEVKRSDSRFDAAFRVIVKERIGALVTEATPLFSAHRKRILALVELNRIPAMHSEQEWATAGGLMSYGSNRVDLSRRGRYVCGQDPQRREARRLTGRAADKV